MPNISTKTLRKLLISALEDKSKSKEHFINAFFTRDADILCLPYILDLMHSKDPVLFQAKDYFKLNVESWHFESKFNYDVLKDLGLMSHDNMIYGQIIDSDDWGSCFNSYYFKMKVDLFYHDENKKIMLYPESIETEKLIKVEKKDIPYFNQK